MSVSMGKNCKLNISPDLTLTELQLKALLAHEVDIHLIRYLNGLKSRRNILRSGTGYYLTDEEGLAVWNAKKYWENRSIYKKLYLLSESKSHSFQHMKDLVYILYPNRSLEGIFKTILRSKKGLKYGGNGI